MDRLYQVVNDNDEIIGYKLRHEISFTKDIYRISAVWLTNDRGEILIAQRKLTKDKDPGKWGPSAAGTLEQNETYETNIYKEAEEEIGLKGVPFVLGPKQRFHVREAFCQWYFGTCNWPAAKFIPQPEEVEQVRWISLKELMHDVRAHPDKFVPSMREILDLLYGAPSHPATMPAQPHPLL